MFMQDTYWRNEYQTHTERLLYKYMYLSLHCKGSKRITQGLRVRRNSKPNRTEIFWPPLLGPSTLCLFRSLDAQAEALGSTLLDADFLYCILSASSLVPKLHRGSRGPFGRVWLSLPNIVYNSVRSLLELELSWLLSWLSYIIVQRPLDRPLDLWNHV